MALTSIARNSKATVTRKPSSKAKSVGVVENTFTVQEAYIYELLNNKLDILRKEAELNHAALKAEITGNRELFLAHFKNVANQFKSMERQFAIVRWMVGLTFTFVIGIMTKLLFF